MRKNKIILCILAIISIFALILLLNDYWEGKNKKSLLVYDGCDVINDTFSLDYYIDKDCIKNVFGNISFNNFTPLYDEYKLFLPVEKGYYDISNLTNIFYHDNDSNKTEVLCNRPNCNHNVKRCDAYFEGFVSQIYYYADKLFIIASEDADLNNRAIYIMDTNGLNKRKIFELKNGDFQLQGIKFLHEKMYFTYVIWGQDGSHEDMTAALGEIDLKKGEFKTLCAFLPDNAHRENMLALCPAYGLQNNDKIYFYFQYKNSEINLDDFHNENVDLEWKEYIDHLYNALRFEFCVYDINSNSLEINPIKIEAGDFLNYAWVYDGEPYFGIIPNINQNQNMIIQHDGKMVCVLREIGQGNIQTYNNLLIAVAENDKNERKRYIFDFNTKIMYESNSSVDINSYSIVGYSENASVICYDNSIMSLDETGSVSNNLFCIKGENISKYLKENYHICDLNLMKES